MICDYCGLKLSKKQQNYNKSYRKTKNNKNNIKFCSNKCYNLYRTWQHGNNLVNFLITYVRKNANQRDIIFDENINEKYITSLFKKQNNKCALSGVVLYSCCSGNRLRYIDIVHRPSIDRIDNKIGYVINNIQLVSVMANWCKNKTSDNTVKRFFSEIKI